MAQQTPQHFQVRATFVGGGTFWHQVDLAVVAGEISFQREAFKATGTPIAAPFEVQVAGKASRKNAGTWAFPDPDGALSRALGLSPMTAPTVDLVQWRARVLCVRVGLALVGLLNLAAAFLVLLPLLTDLPSTDLRTIFPLLTLAVPAFGALAIAVPCRAIGYLRRVAVIIAAAELIPLIFLLDSLTSTVLAVASAMALAAGCWALLRAVPILGPVPD